MTLANFRARLSTGNDRTYHRIQKLHEEAVSLVLRHPDLGFYFVEQLPAGAVLEEDELPVAGLVGPRAVASHHIVVPVGQSRLPSHYLGALKYASSTR